MRRDVMSYAPVFVEPGAFGELIEVDFSLKVAPETTNIRGIDHEAPRDLPLDAG